MFQLYNVAETSLAYLFVYLEHNREWRERGLVMRYVRDKSRTTIYLKAQRKLTGEVQVKSNLKTASSFYFTDRSSG